MGIDQGGDEAPSTPGSIDTRVHLPPVGWLLGPELLSRLETILRSRRDPRQWMPHPPYLIHDEHRFCDGRLVDVRPPSNPSVGSPDGTSSPVTGEAGLLDMAEKTEVWFDYIADLGDATDSMYAIAYACQGDIKINNKVFPRGQFLFLGGDSAYHVADELTLRARVQAPFRWAAQDLGLSTTLPRSWRIYGIPGNHDWYDDLHGFTHLVIATQDENSIDLPGFRKVQRSPYCAIQLPHGWQIWGIDTYVGMDAAQEHYFNSIQLDDPRRRAKRTILCTQAPPVALGTIVADSKHTDALARLGLPESYIDSKDYQLPAGECRLDLSGDIHHYARYVLPRDVIPRGTAASLPVAPPGSSAPRDASTGEREDASSSISTEIGAMPASYMAVVSGLGGAFHHPSFTFQGKRRPVKTFPEPDRSRQEIAAPLFDEDIGFGHHSLIGYVPLTIGVILGISSVTQGGTQWVMDHLFWALRGGSTPPPKTGDIEELLHSFIFIAALLVLYIYIWSARVQFRSGRIAERATVSSDGAAREVDPHTGADKAPARGTVGKAALTADEYYSLALTLGWGGIFMITLFSLSPWMPAGRGAILDVFSCALVISTLIGGPVWTLSGGAKYMTSDAMRGRRFGLGLLGWTHAIVQLITPIVFVKFAMASWRSAIISVILIFVTARIAMPVGRYFFYHGRRSALIAVSLATMGNRHGGADMVFG